jgi:hypothetical protein
MSAFNTDWTGIPDTFERAVVKTEQLRRPARVVHLSKASIRGSEVSGAFKVAEGATVKSRAGKQRIEVECLWFGRKPPTTWMNIAILCKPRFEESYVGPVVVNITRS